MRVKKKIGKFFVILKLLSKTVEMSEISLEMRKSNCQRLKIPYTYFVIRVCLQILQMQRRFLRILQTFPYPLGKL